MQTKVVGFEISISARNDGTLEAVYIKLREGKVSKTVEISEDIAMADYDSSGHLIGFEILGPIKLSKIARLVDAPRRSSFRKAVKTAAPKDLLIV